MKNRKQKGKAESRKQKIEIPSGLEAHPGWKLKLQPFLFSAFYFLLFQ
jgi:hypothetical protein